MKFVCFEDLSIRADDVVAVAVTDNRVTVYLANGPQFTRHFCSAREAQEKKMLFTTMLNRALK